jgi:hypothetical protein
MNDKFARGKNRFDLPEWAGAFGDLGTLIPFVAAYISILKMDANGLLIAFGVALILVGSLYRTPFPVQPMKAIGAAAVSQATLAAGSGSAAVIGAALTTGLMWILLALTGLAGRMANWVPRPALTGVVMGLGFSFMLEGIRMMSASPWIGGLLLALTLVLLGRPRVPAMLVLLAIGVVIALVDEPALMRELSVLKPEFRIPTLAWGNLSMNDLWTGFILLALGSRDAGAEKTDRFVVLATAAFAVLNVGVAVLFGILVHQATRRGWLRVRASKSGRR